MPEFEPRHAFEHIDKLAYEIGPRLAGTRGDQMASDYIKKQFNSYGMNTKIHEFKFVDRSLRVKVTACILAAAFVATLFLPPQLSFSVWLIALALWRSLGKIMPKRRSQNIIAELKVKEPKKHVTITAHYDSARCTVSYGLGIFVKFTFLPTLIAITTVLALNAFSILPAWTFIWIILASIFLPICSSMFISASSRKISPGADDNASGVAVMLEAARGISKEPPSDADLTFIAFGAEEQGLIGSHKLVNENLLPKDTIVLNLDMVGAGSQAYVVEGNGILRRKKTSPELNEKLTTSIKSAGIKPKLWWAALAGHDHIPLVKTKMRATTFSFDVKVKDKLGNYIARLFKLPNAKVRGYQYIHTPRDTPEQIDLMNIERAGAVVLEFIKTVS